LARGTCDDATVAPLRREGRPLPSPRASAPSAALSTLLREAGSMRRNAASRQALGLVRPYILLVGAAAPVPANAPPGVALVRYEDGIASQQDADGVGRRVAMPLAALVLASDPPCLRIIPGDMTDEAKKALRSLESWAAIPMIEKAEQINVF
ncbi:MAG: hypothetical protein JWP20_1086, partial [Roseomonas sp.]|nr:hypothetical protein [Roseomonas sp.]